MTMFGTPNNPPVGNQGKIRRPLFSSDPFVSQAGQTGWSFAVSGTPLANNYFIVTTAQSASISVGDIFLDTLNPGSTFTVTNVGTPAFGFVNITFTPPAGTIMASPDTVTQVTGTGWGIYRYGNAEFNSGVFRGTVEAGSISAGSIGGSTITSSDYRGGTMEETTITFDSNGGELLVYATTTITQTLAGSGNFAVPAGITSLKVQAWGASASGKPPAGSFNGGNGGGGGEFAQESTLAVTAGNSYPYSVGAGGSASGSGNNGGNTTFAGDSVTVTAHGGLASGSGGTGSTNSIHFNGGNGGASGGNISPGGSGGGGGGGSAGPSSAGHNGANASGTTGGAGGTAVTGGGAGGKGGNASANGTAGASPGGGGGGAGAGATEGAGANGKLIVSYVSSSTLITAISAVAGTDALSNAFASAITGTITAFQPNTSPQVAETWHNCALAAQWSTATGCQTPQYRLSADGTSIDLRGRAQFTANGTTGLASPNTVFTIPAAYIPANSPTHGYAVTCYGSPALAANRVPSLVINTVAGSGIVQIFEVTCVATNGTIVQIDLEGTFRL